MLYCIEHIVTDNNRIYEQDYRPFGRAYADECPESEGAGSGNRPVYMNGAPVESQVAMNFYLLLTE